MSRYTYKYPRPMVTVDTVLVEKTDKATGILLIKRASAPYEGRFALPGGFLNMDEPPEDGARRELLEETGIKAGELFQVGAFGAPRRDPRGRNISIAYTGVVDGPLNPKGGDDAAAAAVFETEKLPELAFDHSEIIRAALDRLKSAGLV